MTFMRNVASILLIVAGLSCSSHAFTSSISGGNGQRLMENKVGANRQQSTAFKQSSISTDQVAYPRESEDVKEVEVEFVNAVQENNEKREFTPFQQFARITPVATMIAYAINQEPFDQFVANVWDAIYNFGPAQIGLFEASIAVLGFTVWIIAHSHWHHFLSEDELQKVRLDNKKEVPKEQELITQMIETPHVWFNPMASYLASIWIYQQIFHTHQALPEVAPAFGVLVAEVLFGVWFYDLCFYPIHWLMHHSKWGKMRRIHGYHHRMSGDTALQSLETVQHSYIDGALQVGVNIFVQHISPFGGPKHTLSRLLHNIIVTQMLAEAHSGYNMPWYSHNIFPEFLGGAPRHDRHHHDGRVYYHQYFKYLDDFFGFTDEAIDKKKQAKMEERASATNNEPATVPVLASSSSSSSATPSVLSTKNTNTPPLFFATNATVV